MAAGSAALCLRAGIGTGLLIAGLRLGRPGQGITIPARALWRFVGETEEITAEETASDEALRAEYEALEVQYSGPPATQPRRASSA